MRILKVEVECAACILARGAAETCEATTDLTLRFKTMEGLIKFLNEEFKPTAVSAALATKRERLIRQLTGNSDPYKHSKKVSNEKAMQLLPYARKLVESGYSQQERFKKACLCAIVGNIMEFDIPGHKFTSASLRKSFKDAAKDLVIDDMDKAYELTRKAQCVLFLADNAGEIVFDTLLVEQLKNMRLTVTYVVKNSPVINDATIDDAKFSGMDKLADEILTTGTDAVGLEINEMSPSFLRVYDAAELVFAKGMGYAETLTEYELKKPHFLMFRTKCAPVANYFHVPRDKNVAKLML